MDRNSAREELKRLNLNPDHRAEIVLRPNQRGDQVLGSWINRVNELLKIAQAS